METTTQPPTPPFQRVVNHLRGMLDSEQMDDEARPEYTKAIAVLEQERARLTHEEQHAAFLAEVGARVKRFYVPAEPGQATMPLTTDRLLQRLEEHDPTGLIAVDLVEALRAMEVQEQDMGDMVVWMLKPA